MQDIEVDGFRGQAVTIVIFGSYAVQRDPRNTDGLDGLLGSGFGLAGALGSFHLAINGSFVFGGFAAAWTN